MAAPLPPSVAKDLAQLNIDDAVVGHARLWETYGRELTDFAVKLGVGLAILLATFWAAGWGAGLARRLIARLHGRHGAPDTTLQSFVGSLVRYLVGVVGVVAVLEQLGVKTTSVLAVLGAASIAVGLALQGALSNVAAGVMLLIFRPYRIGDYVELSGGRQGVVRTLDLFVTELTTLDNLKVVAPNGKIFGDTIVNYSANGRRRLDVSFHIPPARDLCAVLEGLKAIVADDERALKDPPPSFEALSLNEVFAEGAVRVWIDPSDLAPMKTRLVLAIQKLSLEQDKPPQPVPPASSA